MADTLRDGSTWSISRPALFLITGRRWVSRAALVLFVAMSLGVAWSRVGLGAHWPTDTLGGFLVGASLLLAAEFFVGSSWAVEKCGRCRIHATAPPPQDG